MLLALSAWMGLMSGSELFGSETTGSITGTAGRLSPDAERVRRALHAAVTAHPLHRDLVTVHQLGGCQFYAFAGAMLLQALGFGTAEVALGRVAFRTARRRWIGYPTARADVRVPDPAERREETEAFPFHAWIRLKARDGRRRIVDFDLSNVLREVHGQAPLEILDFHSATTAFWGDADAARAAGLRFETRRRLHPDALMDSDRRVFAAIAEDARSRLQI